MTAASRKPAEGALDYQLKQCRHGLFLYNRNDIYVGGALERFGEFSEGEFEVMRQLCRPGSTVLDIGANIGAHTVPLAQHVGPRGHVIAFEPQRLIHQLLCANVALNRLTNVTAHWAALGSESGSVVIPELDHSKRNNFGGIPINSTASGVTVPLWRIDDLGLANCDFMKIDVEGFELEVLKGADATLRRLRPRIYVENDRKDKSAALIAHLQGLGYRLYWSLPPLFRADNFAGSPDSQGLNVVSINMLCLPPGSQTKVNGARPVLGPDDDWREARTRPVTPP